MKTRKSRPLGRQLKINQLVSEPTDHLLNQISQINPHTHAIRDYK